VSPPDTLIIHTGENDAGDEKGIRLIRIVVPMYRSAPTRCGHWSVTDTNSSC